MLVDELDNNDSRTTLDQASNPQHTGMPLHLLLSRVASEAAPCNCYPLQEALALAL